MEMPSKIELHYYFSDSSHAMSALVKNRCEAEFIAVAIEVAEILEVPFELECEALAEGGIREVWKAIGENSAQLALVISTLALIWSVVPKTDQELLDLQKEDVRLSIEQRKLELEKLKKDVAKKKISKRSLKTAVAITSRSYKVATRKSNFYKTLVAYDKVTKLGFSELSLENEPLAKERVVAREKFQRFILTSQELNPHKDSAARIEIVAPVLTEGKAKWKGLYEGQPISFAMNDKEFRQAVLAKQLSFKNGDAIVCVLSIFKRVDELGEVITSGYAVEVVLENIHSGISSETKQGRQYRHTKKLSDSQSDMFN